MKTLPILVAGLFLAACEKPQQPVVEQYIPPVEKETAVLTVDVSGEILLPGTEASLTVSVQTNQETYEVVTKEEWAHVSEKTEDHFTLILDDNPDPVKRYVSIQVFAPTAQNPEVFRNFTLVQDIPELPVYKLVDIDKEGTSNAYVIDREGRYGFSATIRGNGRTVEGLPEPAPLSPSKAILVWQSRKGFIQEVTLENGRVLFTAALTGANALIAVTDPEDVILWSWHIWAPGFAIEERSMENGGSMMHANLGATSDAFTTSEEAYGLLYQWGRKDPFPGSPIRNNGTVSTTNAPVYDMDGAEVTIGHSSMFSTEDNHLAYSISHPTVCLSNYKQLSVTGDWLVPEESNPAFWGDSAAKTYYDPCPPGWRVPPVSAFRHLTSSGGYTWAEGEAEGTLGFYDLSGPAQVAVHDYNQDGQVNLKDYTDGWWFLTDRSCGAYSYFPAGTRYDGSYAMFMGSMAGYWGNYWTSAPASSSYGTGRSLAMSFQIHAYGEFSEYNVTLSPVSAGNRADAYSVRCVRE